MIGDPDEHPAGELSPRNYHALLLDRVVKERVSGPRYAHEVVLRGTGPTWIKIEGAHGHRWEFRLDHGCTRAEQIKTWRVRCIALSDRHQQRTGKRWRIEASRCDGGRNRV